MSGIYQQYSFIQSISHISIRLHKFLLASVVYHTGSLTLCGALRSRWTPASWLMRGMSSLKVYRGGLVGSGKLVLLNGSVSSKN